MAWRELWEPEQDKDNVLTEWCCAGVQAARGGHCRGRCEGRGQRQETGFMGGCIKYVHT